MSALPRILVIDDLIGASAQGMNRDREAFCFRLGLQDVTGDTSPETINAPIAEAVFVSGQRRIGDRIENDTTGTLAAARRGAESYPRWAMILLDMHFKTGELVDGVLKGRDGDSDPRRYFGLTILRELRRDTLLCRFPVVVLSSMNRADIENQFSDYGASDFKDKSTLSRETLERILDDHALLEDDIFAGRSLPLQQCLLLARRRAKFGNDNIVVLGETGTGKEWLAAYVHKKSGRSGPYVPLFTQGVPETLVEDRLFGHDKGAFEGASQAVPGAAETADKGTLFIDEFGDIPIGVQGKLLRLLDKNTREVQRLGSQQAKKLDLQVIMASNRLDLFNAEDFRKDLLFRAKIGDAITIPPLRDRREDIPVLAEYFLRKYQTLFEAEKRTLSAEALDLLTKYDWPGNVRELEKVIERAVFDYQGIRVLSANHLKLTAETQKDGRQDTVKHSAQTVTTHEKTPERMATATLSNITALLSAFSDGKLAPTEVSGSLPKVEDATSRLMLSLLRSALVMTKRVTPETPDGRLSIHPAIKLLTGNARISASKSADVIKRITSLSPNTHEMAMADPVLRDALAVALRLRPKANKKCSTAGTGVQ